ncbi:MAG TPA: GNAT family N-acetyltransferase [Longimicrobiales bacterium]|nr:GNAT family N-acetyltransferase [Longimicrobiales bacterium]
MPQTPKLVRIRIYPVKSLQGFDRDVWELDEFGLRYDRRWMIVDPDGRFMTQRKHPGMAEISVELQADSLILTAPMRSPVEVPLDPESGPTEPVTVWGETVAARAVSDDANRWLGEALLTPCRLVYMPDESVRSVAPGYVDHEARLAFTDGFPLLLASEESLAELNRRLDEPVTMRRFRPNLVVQGVGEPHAEDTWRRIRVSGTVMHVVKPCSRCAVVDTDQETGDRGKEPLQTLATYRTADGEVYFGQNTVHVGTGRIRVGDDVEVLETGQPMPTLDAEQPAAAAARDVVAALHADGEPEPELQPELEVLAGPEPEDSAEPEPGSDMVFPFEIDPTETLADLAAEVENERAAGASAQTPSDDEAAADPVQETEEAAEQEPGDEESGDDEPGDDEPGDEASGEPSALRRAASRWRKRRRRKSGSAEALEDVRYVLGERPDPDAIEALYDAAGRPEAAGDQDAGRFERSFGESNVVVAAWLDDDLVGVLRAWSDGARDGFISDLVVHPDHVGAGIALELVRRAMDAHPGVRWVLRASPTSPYLGSALGWTHLASGWFISPG